MVRTASHEMSFDDFLGHSGGSGGGGFLEKWKEDGEIDVFLHPKALPAALWSHSWYKIQTYTDKKSGREITKVFGDDWNCLETEALLRKQAFRDDDDRRQHPPAICPLCLTLEWVRDQVNDNHLNWLEPIFQFDAPGEPSTIVRAGGFCGLFREPKQGFSKEDMDALTEANVKIKEAYRQESFARLQYVFRVISAKDPGAGCVITREAQTLGKRVQKVIKDLMADVGEKGDPRVNPYGFHWTFDKNKSFGDMYDAVRRESIKITPAILSVFEQEPPSIHDMIQPGDPVKLRASMESHALIEFPWDELFAPSMAVLDELNEPDEFDQAIADRKASVSVPASAPIDEPEEVQCDICQKIMTTAMDTCPHCGVRYDLKTGQLIRELKPEPPKPAPRLRSRTAIGAPAAPAAAPTHSPTTTSQPGANAAPEGSFRAPSRRRGRG